MFQILVKIKLNWSKRLVFILCSCALLYQSINLYIDYKKYQTIVTVNIDKEKFIEFPGVSLCFSNPFVNLTKQTEVYKLTKMPIPKGIWRRAKHKDPQGFYQLVSKGNTWDATAKFFLNQTLFMKDAFGDPNDELIDCFMDGNNRCGHVIRIMGFYSYCRLFFSSILYNSTFQKPSKKYFNVQENSKENVMAVIQITNQDYEWRSMIKTISVLLMESDAIPFFSVQQLSLRQNGLQFGRQYDVTFNKETIVKIGHPYEPKCINYNGQFDSHN